MAVGIIFPNRLFWASNFQSIGISLRVPHLKRRIICSRFSDRLE